jgi:DNA-binding transcriptional regulator YiaG
MKCELVKLFGDRPAFAVDKDGWTVCVSIHDAWHLKTRRWYKQLIKNSSTYKIRDAIKTYNIWLEEEKYYYSQLKLYPPGWTLRYENIQYKELIEVIKIKKIKSTHHNKVIAQKRKTNKLNFKTANEIREKYKNNHSKSELARIYKVSYSTIKGIINNELWNGDS